MNVDFALALHTVGFLTSMKGAPLTSERIAETFGTSPVVVRRILSRLGLAGIIESRRGAGGGSVLARDPSEINLRHIYEAVVVETELLKRPPELDSIPSKLLGRYIDRLFTDAEEALLENLESITVQEMDSKMAPAICKALKSTERKVMVSH